MSLWLYTMPGEAGANGLKSVVLVLPLRVAVKLFVLASRKRLLWQVSRTVFVIAVSGVVGGENADV